MDRELASTQRSPLARNIERLRIARGWTQPQLAQRAGVSQGSVSKIESGTATEIRRQTQEKIAAAFGISADALAVDIDQVLLQPGFAEFVSSTIVKDITDEERLTLASTNWNMKGADAEVWYSMLQTLRLVRSRQAGT